MCVFFFFILRRQPRSTLFPYTTLFRSALKAMTLCWRRLCLRFGIIALLMGVLLVCLNGFPGKTPMRRRSEEHTSELQSRPHLVCRLLLEKKNTITTDDHLPASRFFAYF